MKLLIKSTVFKSINKVLTQSDAFLKPSQQSGIRMPDYSKKHEERTRTPFRKSLINRDL